jgi:hypothetical protein
MGSRKWGVEKIRSDALYFLTAFWSDAYEEFYKHLVMWDSRDRPSWSDLERAFGRSEEWQQFEKELLAVARVQGDPSATNAEAEKTSDNSNCRTNAAFEASEDYCSIRVRETRYSLTELAGQIVKALHEAAIEDRPVSGKELRNKTNCGRIRDAFRKRDGPKFWEEIIVKPDKNMYTVRGLAIAPLEPQE